MSCPITSTFPLLFLCLLLKTNHVIPPKIARPANETPTPIPASAPTDRFFPSLALVGLTLLEAVGDVVDNTVEDKDVLDDIAEDDADDGPMVAAMVIAAA
jgi:hypothetical protein